LLKLNLLVSDNLSVGTTKTARVGFLKLSSPFRILIWSAIGFATFYGALEFFEEILTELVLSISSKIIISSICSIGSVVMLADEKIWKVIQNQRELNRINTDIDTIKNVLNPVQAEIFANERNQSENHSDLLNLSDGWSLLELGNDTLDNNSDKKAAALLEKSLSHFRKSGDEKGLVEALNSLSEAYRRIGRLSEAEILIRECIALAESSNNLDKMFAMYYCLGRIYLHENDPVSAISSLKKSLDVSKKNEEIILSLCLMGQTHSNVGDKDEAERVLLQAFNIVKSDKDNHLNFVVATSLAELYTSLGEFSRALEFCQFAIEASSSDPDKLKLAIALEIKGNVLIRVKEYREAMEVFEKCVEISKKMKDVSYRASFLHNLSLAHNKLGNRKKEEQFLLESLEYQKQFSLEINPDSLINLGVLELEKGNFDFAEVKFSEALEIYRKRRLRPREANALANLGLVQQKKKNYEAAETYYNRSLAIDKEIGDKGQVAGGLRDLAKLMGLIGDKERESDFYNEATKIQVEIGIPLIEDTFFD
jgi:tetratricopeptide (TPR) repeat protein